MHKFRLWTSSYRLSSTKERPPPSGVSNLVVSPSCTILCAETFGSWCRFCPSRFVFDNFHSNRVDFTYTYIHILIYIYIQIFNKVTRGDLYNIFCMQYIVYYPNCNSTYVHRCYLPMVVFIKEKKKKIDSRTQSKMKNCWKNIFP